ncbi:MAG: hypothetical protein ACKVVP_13660 [Chloroflexota bacterium]
MISFTRSAALTLAITGGLMLTACSSAAPSPTAAAKATQAPVPAASPASAAPAAAAPAASPSTSAAASPAAASPAAVAPAAAAQKINANTATTAELQVFFEAAGLPNAARWAREVDEYKPYPSDDPSWGKLRRELAKYNPSAEVLEKLISLLTA